MSQASIIVVGNEKGGAGKSTIAIHTAVALMHAGAKVALVGRNGAGKSTRVGILTGLRAPDAGDIRFSGAPSPALADREAWRRLVACVYQHSTIIPDLTVAEWWERLGTSGWAAPTLPGGPASSG